MTPVTQARSALANEVRRAKRAGDRSTSGIVEAKRALAEANLRQYIERVLASAPPLSSGQRSRLAALLRGTK